MTTRGAVVAFAFALAVSAHGAVLNVPAQFPTIQAAIAAATNGDEVVVAPGTYTGTFDTSGKALTLRSSGGAASTTLTSPAGSPVLRVQSGEGPNTVIKNFTINDGGTSGGGAFIQLSDPSFVGCVFTGNGRMELGGSESIGNACYVLGGDPSFDQCSFVGNLAGGTSGGCVYISGGSVHFTSTSFLQGASDWNSAVWLRTNASTVYFQSCNFAAPTGFGNGLLIYNFSRAFFVGCQFNPAVLQVCTTYNNSSISATGCSLTGLTAGFLYASGAGLVPTQIAGCEFVACRGNIIYLQSGHAAQVIDTSFTDCGDLASATCAIYCYLSEGVIERCNFTRTRSNSDGAAVRATLEPSQSLEITGCTFDASISLGSGGSVASFGGMRRVANCSFTHGFAAYGSAMHFDNGGQFQSLDVVNCRFEGNTAGVSGGLYMRYSTATVSNCLFANLDAASVGGGLYCTNGSDPVLKNCTFSGITAANGACAYAYDASSNPTFQNCVIWDMNNDVGIDIFGGPGGATVTNCLVQGGYGGALNQDPMFRNPSQGDFRLKLASPAIDAGNNSLIATDALDLDDDGNTAEQAPFDLDGAARLYDGDASGSLIVDLGCYEFHNDGAAGPAADLNGDGVVDGADLGVLLGAWGTAAPGAPADLNDDGMVDGYDLGSLLGSWTI